MTFYNIDFKPAERIQIGSGDRAGGNQQHLYLLNPIFINKSTLAFDNPHQLLRVDRVSTNLLHDLAPSPYLFAHLARLVRESDGLTSPGMAVATRFALMLLSARRLD